MDMGRVARGAAWAVVGGVLLVVVAYLVLLAINWKDEAASPQALRLERIILERPPVDDAANAYVYALGLGVREDQDPLAWGRTRKAFLENITPQQTVVADFPGPDAEPLVTWESAGARLMGGCHEADQGCLDQLHRNPGEIDRVLESEAWLLDRYLALIASEHWRESIPRDFRAPFPRYRPMLDGQQLLMAKAWRHARRGEADATSDLLQRDLTFWRMVLRSSDLLITKMIAVAAIDRHFKVGNLILRELHDSGATSAAPAAWAGPMSREERSMQRTLAGEWLYVQASLESSALLDADSQGVLASAWDHALRPLLKKQATANLAADRVVRITDRLDVELIDLPRAFAELRAQEGGGDLHFYNPVGHILYGVGAVDFQGYAGRVADLEGTRRAALLAAQSRADTQASDMPARVQRSPLRDPYTDQPFAWDEASRSIVFTGLAAGERGTYALLL